MRSEDRDARNGAVLSPHFSPLYFFIRYGRPDQLQIALSQACRNISTLFGIAVTASSAPSISIEQ